MKLWVRNILLVSILGTIWAIILIGALAYQRDSVSQSEAWVNHTQQVLETSKNLDADIQRLIAHQRGYIITRDKTFMEIYEKEKQNILDHIITIAKLTEDNPPQAERVKELQRDFLKLTNLLEKRIQDLGPTKSLMPWQLDDTQNMNGIDKNIAHTIDTILKSETDVFRQRLHIEHKHKELYYTMLNAGIVITILLILAFNVIIMRLNHRRRHAELESLEMQDRLALAMKSTSDGVFDWNLENGMVYYSPRFKQMLGLRDEEMENTIEAFNALVHPDDLDSVWAYANHYLSGQLNEYSTIFRMKHASGGWVWINCRARGIFDVSGHAIRLIGAHTDITQLKEIEEKLKIEKEAAIAANTAKSEFLANMSHEIRTPLNAIIGVSNILTRSKNLTPEKRDNLITTLQDSSSSLLDLINGILDFAKIESGDFKIESQPFELPKVFEQVVNIMAMKAREKKLEFSLDYSQLEKEKHLGDEMRFRQILINLVGNAIKFTEVGSVHVSARHENNQLIVEVSDTGIGISEEYQAKIFNKFDQADGSITRRFGGTGLGLAISQQLAGLMGGNISVASESGRGSTFSLRLPSPDINIDSEDTVTSPAPVINNTPLISVAAKRKLLSIKQKSKGTPQLLHNQKILIAEDYSGNVIVITYLLDSLGIIYDIAHDGQEAIDMYKKSPYPLILMDVQMPYMDGLQATQAIREFEREAGVKPCTIIAMTAHALAGDSERCLKAGMDDYLSKPLMEKDIREKFEFYLMQAA